MTTRKRRIGIFAGRIIFSFLFSLGILFAMQRNCYANNAGYRTEEYKIDMVVHENNTYSITEYRKVNFTEERHGIKRSIPQSFNLIMDGKKYDYRTPIRKTWVKDDPYKIEKEDGDLIFKIGDPSKTIIGEKEYTLSYIIDYGDDRVPAYDTVYHNLVGIFEDCYIDDVQFTITFDKPVSLVAGEDCFFYAGAYGEDGENRVHYQINGNTITGSVQNLCPGEALTANIYLPADYYKGFRRYHPIIPFMVFVLLVACAAGLFINKKKAPKYDVVQTVEFYPPDGITSAEVGYIIDGSADDKDILSLFLWFAEKGFIEIHEEDTEKKKKKLYFYKKKDLDEGIPQYARILFNAMFRGKDVVSADDFSDIFYDGVQSAKGSLEMTFSGNRELESQDGYLLSLLSIFGITILSFAGWFGCKELAGLNLFGSIFGAFLLMLWGLKVRSLYMNRYFIKKSKMVIWNIIGVIFAIIGCSVNSYSCQTYQNYSMPLWIGIVSYVAVYIAARIDTCTPYKAEMAGKLLGLKEFIKTAELDKINELVEENPQYFFAILPYAYVFDLTNKWVKQFESLVVEPPTWYYSNTGAFSTMYFMNHMDNTYRATKSAMQHVASERSASSSGGSGGGGGFSGGGGGGGGSSSW